MKYDFTEQTGKSWGDFLTVEANTPDEAMRKAGVDHHISIYEKFDNFGLAFTHRIYEMKEHDTQKTICICSIPKN